MDVTGLLSLLLVAHTAMALTRDYILVNQRKPWPEAQTYCRENADDMATIETAEEQDKLEAMMVNCIDTVAWVGLYEDLDSWRWSIDNTYVYEGGNTNLGSWFAFTRDNVGSKEHCAAFSSGTLDDKQCTLLHKSVCYDETSNTYILVTDTKTWTAAQSYCRATYTDLASMKTEQEKNSIMAVISSDVAWIGLSRNAWIWSDKTSYGYSKWAGADPNVGTENCVDIHVGGWYDRSCSVALPFFCQVKRRRIVKVVIKANNSLDLSDLKVQEEILRKMEGGFAAQGLSQHTMLNWRRQPTGNVFNQTQTEL